MKGNLLKMDSELQETVVYHLSLGDETVEMNQFLGKEIHLEFLNEIHCIKCGRRTSKSFAQGFCYPCFTTAPETSECIIRPELCMAHEGISRDLSWSEGHCLQDHYVYLAVSSGLKVGVTRSTQIPNRWIDQGAWKAVRLAKTPNRYLAGAIEVSLKEHMNDKTNWRKMLTNDVDTETDLLAEKTKARGLLPPELTEYFIPEDEITEISYPVLAYPEKVRSVGFDKQTRLGGTIAGIKGQYLIFDDGSVLNIRKHNGYLVEMII